MEVFLIRLSINSRLNYIYRDIILLDLVQNLKTADGTPKEWSMPINRVDIAAYHHDLCNSKYSDTKTRNEGCDKTMLNELDGIMNPTLRERIDKSIVGKLIKAKVHF